MSLPLKWDVPKSPSGQTSSTGAIGKHALLEAVLFSVSTTVHHELCALLMRRLVR